MTIKALKANQTVDDFQRYFEGMYGDINSQRSWHEIYGYLARTSGYLSRRMVKGTPQYQDFIRPITWLFALASKLDISLQTAFMKKFPEICPYCVENICKCHVTNKKPLDSNMPPYKIRETRESWYGIFQRTSPSFENFVKNIDTIYPGNRIVWNYNGSWMSSTKLFEEVAELQEAIAKLLVSRKTKESVEEEFADVLAWLLSAWVCEYPEVSLTEQLIDYFYNGCPVCLKDTCKCETDDARIQSIVDSNKFKEMKLQFLALDEAATGAGVSLDELIKSLNEIETTQSDTLLSATTAQASEKYQELDKKLEKTEQVTTVLANIASLIGAAVSI